MGVKAHVVFAGGIDSTDLANDAVITAKIADGQVTTAKIGDTQVTQAKLAGSSVGSNELATDAVTTAKIATDAVTTAKIANGQVTDAKIVSVGLDKLPVMGDGSVLGRAPGSGSGVPVITDSHDMASKSTYEVLSPAQITSDQTGYNPTGLDDAGVVRLDSDASRTIHGISSLASNPMKIKRIWNVGSNDIVIAHQSGTEGTPVNRFTTHTGANITIQPGESLLIFYDLVASVGWRTAP